MQFRTGRSSLSATLSGCVAALAPHALGCSSSAAADVAGDAASPNDGSPALTGSCATLAACCP
jgi:hypothetical protein